MPQSSQLTFAAALDQLRQFTQDRGWGNYHQPKDLLLKLMEEVGELAELFEWQTNQEIMDSKSNPKKQEAVGDEAADVLIIVLMLMDLMGVEVDQAFARKLEKNSQKYPLKQDPEEIKQRKIKGL
ncbi:MAG: nucleotide pyrophosphohydrolase [Candidatus Pacebacteria bacterium]|nr:nucleotide pyrophosphohydrolase [Candidatus Paceibacterota bacterium]